MALAVRLAVAAELWNLPIVRTPKLDSFEYVSWARRLAAGNLSWPVIAQHGPGYPFFLASLLVLGSGSLSFAMAAQAIVGALTAVTLALTARQWAGSRAGLLAGLVYALYGPAAYVDTALLSEGLLLFLLALPLLILSREPVTRTRAAAAGAALGAATLVRPTAVLTAVACAAWLLLSVRRRQSRAATLAAHLAVTALLVASLAVLKNWSVSRSLGIQGYGGVNFYIGNSPLHAGRSVFRLGAGWDGLNAEASRAGIADPVAQDRYYVAKTLAEIRRYPAAFITLLAKKALWVVQAEEIRDSHSFYFFTGQSAVLRVLPRMAILFPLACVGALAMARRRARASLLAYHAAAAVAGTVLLVLGMRYRMPLVPALAIAAGAGLSALADSVAACQVRDAAIYASVAIVAVLVSHLQSDPQNRNPAEEWAFTGSSLVTEHNLAEAEAAYRRALSLDQRSGFAWDGLGLVQYDAGRLADARQAFDRALALDPDSARATFHIALVDERDGRASQAIAGYARALALSPNDAEIAGHLGAALGMAGRIEEARTQFRRVVELTPSNGEAWLDLCLLSLDSHDVDAAAAALQHAREWGATPDRLTFASEALARATSRPSRDD